MKSGSKPKKSSIARSGSSVQGKTNLQLRSGQPTSRTSTTQTTRSKRRASVGMTLSKPAQALALSQSMEKSFRRLKVKAARRAYVEAELAIGLAHQIRVIRQQRNWTQGHLAKRLKTTQGAVSRMEDPSYGKFSIRSLLQVADVFDVALQTRFLPFSEFMFQTWDTTPQRLQVLPYKIDAERVCFYAETTKNTYVQPFEFESTLASSSYRSVISITDQSRDSLPVFTIATLSKPTTASTFMKLGDHQFGFEGRTQLAQESEWP